MYNKQVQAIRMVVGAFVVFGIAMSVLSNSSSSSSSSSTPQRRQLRFFDPDHRTCGTDPLAHLFAVHFLYGAKSTEEDYYMRRTISTFEEIPEDKEKINHILQVLSCVSRLLNRPIRINKRVISGYNQEPRQAYALVHAANLKSVGVDIVESGYWIRAGVRQHTIKTEHLIDLKEKALDVLSKLTDDEDKHEFVFEIEQLLAIDVHSLGNMIGVEGGYKDGAWTTAFACFPEHPRPHAIPPANAALSKLW
jgi:hypothetical protein